RRQRRGRRRVTCRPRRLTHPPSWTLWERRKPRPAHRAHGPPRIAAYAAPTGDTGRSGDGNSARCVDDTVGLPAQPDPAVTDSADDILHRFLIERSDVRGAIVRLGPAWRTIRGREQYPAGVAAL